MFFSKPIVLVTVYFTTDAESSQFEEAIRAALWEHLRSGVLGEFTLELAGFEFERTKHISEFMKLFPFYDETMFTTYHWHIAAIWLAATHKLAVICRST